MIEVANMTKMHTNLTEHPGVFIKEELEARGWLQADLAYILGMPEQSVNTILSGKRGITPRVAKLLAEAFEVPAEFFTNLQNAYDLSKADDVPHDVVTRAKFQNEYPVRDMIKRGWLEDTESELLEEQMKRFFLVSESSDDPHLAHAAMKSSKYGDSLPAPQLVWLFRAHHVAKDLYPDTFSNSKLIKAVKQLHLLRGEPEEIRHVPRIMSEAGVRFVLIECLPKSLIDGACFWLDDNSPVIAMSLRFDRLDNFWFVLRHEIEHVLQGHGKNDHPIVDIEMEKEKDNLPEEEIIANKAGADFCVDQKKMNSFYARKSPYISKVDVLSFAARMEIHPALVVGQIHYRNKRYQTFREHLKKIRKHILPSAVVDGWGEIAPIDL